MDSLLDNLDTMDINVLQTIINQINSENIEFITETTTSGSENLFNKPQLLYGCEHYLLRCKIVSPCCKEIFSCRFCHDEIHFDKNSDPKTRHKLDRFNIKEIMCTNCEKIQPVSQFCLNCNICFGLYFCNKCNLFDDVDKGQFHCDKCGFCRIGGDENFKHCDKCSICINKNTNNHKCIEIKDSLCSVCMADLFTSTELIIQMECSHYIHRKCYYELLDNTYKCPLCSKSIINTDKLVEMIDIEIEQTPMPPDLDFNISILCNDCSTTTEVKFHVVGHKCPNCKGYNTRKI